MPKKKSTRGRRPGHLGKAHKDVHEKVFADWQKLSEGERKKLIAEGTTPEQIEYWRHCELASRGNYPFEVAYSAFILGLIADKYEEVLARDRAFLEANRREVKIPLPYLPRGEHFEKSEVPQMLHGSGHDVIWVINFLGYHQVFCLMGYFIRAAVEKRAEFFEEFARRIRNSFAMKVPLTSGAEPVYDAMIELKRLYQGFDGGFLKEPPTDKRKWDSNSYFAAYFKRELPKLFPILKLPPNQRPPLTVAQIREFVCEHRKLVSSDRALIRAAKLMGILVARRGRPKKGT